SLCQRNLIQNPRPLLRKSQQPKRQQLPKPRLPRKQELLQKLKKVNSAMKKDLPENIVEEIGVAVGLENETPEARSWYVYLINRKKEPLKNVLVSSKGYDFSDGKDIQTTLLRHFIGDVDGNSFAKIEPIDEALFGLTNEYWLSYYIGETIYDKKFIFLPESIVDSNFVKIPILNKPGVLIG